MGIEAISGAGMTYQGSTSTTEVKAENQKKLDAGEIVITAEKIAKDATALDTKKTDSEGQEGYSDAQQNAAEYRQNQIKKAVEDINKKAKNSEAIFGIHEGTNRVTIKLVDRDTKEIIKELPPEKTLDMIARVWEMAGIMVDEKR